jgi:hypothetical protein
MDPVCGDLRAYRFCRIKSVAGKKFPARPFRAEDFLAENI